MGFSLFSFGKKKKTKPVPAKTKAVEPQQQPKKHNKTQSVPPISTLAPPPPPAVTSGSGSPASNSRRNTRTASVIDSKRISSVPTSFLRQSTVVSQSDDRYYHKSTPSAGSGRGLSITKGLNATLVQGQDVPEELVPIITLIHAQQARIYSETYLQIPCEDEVDGSKSWMVVSAKLSGTELAIWEVDENSPTEVVSDVDGSFKPIYVNIVDAEYTYMPTAPDTTTGEHFFDLAVHLTTSKSYLFRFGSAEDLHYFYSALLLSQFEYRQLQESFTGALFSVKAVHFSDVRTLLDPTNRFVKSEWCIIRFPFLNNKWIRCYVSIVPGDKNLKKKESKSKPGKVEIYTQKTNSKKFLLASIVNAKSCFSVYPENPSFINNNSLIRLSGDCFVNEDLLAELIRGEAGGERSRSSSMGQRLTSKGSSSSLRLSNVSPHKRNPSLQKIRARSSSMDSSNSSFSLTKKNKNKGVNVSNTHLCYIIPESHSGVEPAETMIRNLIPMMNAFKLYGRPTKFISDRAEKTSMLFGLPQLPHTQYLDAENAYKLLDLNIGNSLTEKWNNFDWMQVFKEMVYFKLTKGWVGTGSVFDTFKEGLLYTKERQAEEDYYNAEEARLEFVDFKDSESEVGPSSPTSPIRSPLSRPQSPLGFPQSPLAKGISNRQDWTPDTFPDDTSENSYRSARDINTQTYRTLLQPFDSVPAQQDQTPVYQVEGVRS